MVLCFQNPHEQLFSDEIRFHHLHGLGNLSQTMPLKLFMINKLKVDSSVTFKGCKAGLVKRLGESKNTKMKTPLCFGLFLLGCWFDFVGHDAWPLDLACRLLFLWILDA